MKREFFPALTGVRALAASLILVHHTLDDSFQWKWLNAIVRELNVGVNMFFVLSGFLIWHIYSRNFKWSKEWFKSYLVKRFARIYPLYFFLTTITLILIYFLHNISVYETLKIYLLNISFLRGFSATYIYTGIPQGWTLTVEEMFYFMIPLLIYLNIYKKIKLFFLGLGIITVGLTLYLIFQNINFLGMFKSLKYLMLTTFFGRFIEFFIGIMLAKTIDRKSYKGFGAPIITTISAILLFLSITLILPALQDQNGKYSIQNTYGFLYGVYVFPVFVATFYWGIINEKSKIRSFFELRFMELLGKSSFALYLLHDGIIASLILTIFWHNKILFVLVIYIFSILLWKFFENPMNKYIRKTISP